MKYLAHFAFGKLGVFAKFSKVGMYSWNAVGGEGAQRHSPQNPHVNTHTHTHPSPGHSSSWRSHVSLPHLTPSFAPLAALSPVLICTSTSPGCQHLLLCLSVCLSVTVSLPHSGCLCRCFPEFSAPGSPTLKVRHPHSACVI